MLELRIVSVLSCLALVADLTAGGCPGDTPVWQMDKNYIIRRLNSAYEIKLNRRYHRYCESSTLQNCTATLIGFKEFKLDSRFNSALQTLLLYEDDNLSIALKWALEKFSLIKCKEVHVHEYPQQDAMTTDLKW